MTKHFTLLFHIIFPILLSIGLAWGQDIASVSPNNENASDKLIQSFRSDLGKFYTVTYSGEFLGQKNNKVYFKRFNDVPLKLIRLKEIKELKQDNKVLIKFFNKNMFESSLYNIDIIIGSSLNDAGLMSYSLRSGAIF